MTLRIILGLILALEAAPAAAQPADASDAARLAASVDPADLLAAANARLFRKHLDAAAAAVPELRNLKATDPAEYDVVAAAGEKAAASDTIAAYPRLQAAYATLYETLSADDLKTLVAYYRSPVGQKIVATGFAALRGATEQDWAAARLSMVSQLSPEERQAVIAFGQTTAARNFSALYGQRQQISQSWSTGLNARMASDETTAMARASTAYEAQHPTSVARKNVP